jgi:hypothetical protein
MNSAPLSEEVAAAIARFFSLGAGPSHSQLSEVFRRVGASRFDPARDGDQTIGKEKRVRAVLSDSAMARDVDHTKLVTDLIARLRASGSFDKDSTSCPGPETIESAQRAFESVGWALSDSGTIGPLVLTGLDSMRLRPAINAQLDRVRNAPQDAALLIGTAKELLEATSRYVLDELGQPARPKATFDELLYMARERLELLPEQVDATDEAGETIREVYDGIWKIARSVNLLRNFEGTGHGRTSTATTPPQTARVVVQAAALLAQMMISTLDARRAPGTGSQ